MSDAISAAQLEAWLDEALPAEEMARLEEQIRSDPALQGALRAIHQRRDSGAHTLGEIWRRHRVSCPTREQWGSYLLGAVLPEMRHYMEFHLQTIGCRHCAANLGDLQRQTGEAPAESTRRRSRYFQSSAGYLRRPPSS